MKNKKNLTSILLKHKKNKNLQYQVISKTLMY